MTVRPFEVSPAGPRHALRRVHIPSCLGPTPSAGSSELVLADLLLDRGRIAAIEPAGTLPAELGPDMDRSMVLPGLLDVHTHLDKGHISPRRQNPTGAVLGASQATKSDRESRWTATDVERRMEFGLKTAYAHGVVAIRTHLDSLGPQAAVSFPVFMALRERWAGRIELQASSIAPMDIFLEEEGIALADQVARAQGRLGCVTYFRALGNQPNSPHFDQAMRNLMRLAIDRGLDLDLHVDETGDPSSRTLLRLAELAIETRFPNRILCGHCCSLAVQAEDIIERTLDACAEARIDIVTLPTVNMYLQSRSPGVTPRWRGVTLVHEMKARGLQVAVAGDNCRDPFYAYGDHDMLDNFVQAVKILQLDHPIGDWVTSVSAVPAELMGLQDRGRLRVGDPADLLVLKARTWSELLSRRQSDRIVLRQGKPIDTTLPDYRLLDDLMEDA